ncbi:hypothetical protein HH214_18545 [Mucilaginibacter robiniae]|uniref:Uncharacterized protein n=1 Tax=Mucilaginibacter robiniae TaxID=2728022 RepID=A0A7L5E3Y8_9SPHI|nr:hypothetical protein [Mucilaginibacter robiniae]QJD97731.1 hypothetical protein HH214_18545 [Mucilaginibacter robiniae]
MKLFLLALLIIISTNSFAQRDESPYVGKKLTLVKDAGHLKDSVNIVTDFFKHIVKWDYRPDNIIYQVGNKPWSYRDSLINKIFVCLSEKKEANDTAYTYLELENRETGIIFYKMNSNWSELVLCDDKGNPIPKKKVVKPVVDPCALIDESYDEFSHTKQYTTAYIYHRENESPFDPTETYHVDFTKYIKKSGVNYYMALETTSNIPLATEQGAIVILKNGKRLKKPLAKVTTTVNSKAEYVRRSFITLTSADIAILKSSPIKRFQLYIDQDIVNDSETVYKMFLCLINKK